MASRHLVYVERHVLKIERHALIVTGEEDLKAQLAVVEAELKATPFVAKPERDKKGNMVLHQLNNDWNT